MSVASTGNSLIPYKSVGIIQELGGGPWQEHKSRKILQESIRKLSPGGHSTLETIEDFIVSIITTLESNEHGAARMQVRLLGNYLRILSHRSPHVKEFIKQLMWGIDAGALDNSCSGEQEAAQAVMQYLSDRNGNKRLNVFDVGANKGAWTLQIANSANNIDIHAFEPNKNLVHDLTFAFEQWQQRGSNTKIFLNMLGLYPTTGKKILNVNGISTEQATLSDSASKNCFENSINSLEIETIRGDDYCSARGISSIDYLKVDTEGTELEVLKSFGSFTEESRLGFIQFEYGNASFYTGASMMEFFDLLGRNYTFAKILPEGLLVEVKYESRLEDFKWCNFLAVNKKYSDFLTISI